MIVDSSAVLAVLLGEDDAPLYANAIEQAADPRNVHCPGAWVSFVIGARKREPGLAAFDRFLEASRIRVVGFDAEQLRFARAAWWNFGKGRHPAALNLGDCLVTPWQKRAAKCCL
jgi:ribonuclease VapC